MLSVPEVLCYIQPMRTLNRLVWGFLALIGCATLGVRGEYVSKPGLDAALDIAKRTYGIDKVPIRVRIVEDDSLTCIDPDSKVPGFKVNFGLQCKEGYQLEPGVISLAYRGQPWHESALCHEVGHVATNMRLQPDPLHLSPFWETEVPKCIGAQAAAGY